VTEVLTNSGLQLVLLLLVAPLLSGMTKTLKARLQTRRGPGVLQSYRDIFKLLRKGMVIPETASWIFSAAPYIVFGTAVSRRTYGSHDYDPRPVEPVRWGTCGSLSFGAGLILSCT